jgi:hypothetical protein
MTGIRPVRLTFPAYDIGAADIRANGKWVGRVLGEFYGWEAVLSPEADPKPGTFDPREAETVWMPKLGDLRRVLRERVALKGPWWAT